MAYKESKPELPSNGLFGTDINTSKYPSADVIFQSLMGKAPDQLGLSVLNPAYEDLQQKARIAFYLGIPLQALLGFVRIGPRPQAANNVGGLFSKQESR